MDGNYVFDIWYGNPVEEWTYGYEGTYRPCLVVRDGQGLFSPADCITITIPEGSATEPGASPLKSAHPRFRLPINIP
jgi:hypothetical protein